jgi:hypothetical protein
MFSPTYALNEILPVAEAAYDLTLMPDDLTVIAPIEPENFGDVVLRVDSATGQRTVIVDICGTRSVIDGKPSAEQWLTDLDINMVPNPYGPGYLHRGFLNRTQAVHKSIWDAIDSVEYDALIIVAHSLGVSIGTDLALQIAEFKPQYAARVVGYLFEGPRVMDAVAAADFDSKFPNWWRIVNPWDIVPNVPTSRMGFKHVGNEIRLPSQFNADVHYNHGLETGCRPGLVKLVQDAALQTGGKA